MRLPRPSVVLALILGATALFAGGVRAQEATSEPAPAVTNPPIPSPKPTAEDPKIHKLAVQQFLAWQTGAIDRDLYSERVNGELTDDLMDKGTKTLANLGPLQNVQFQGISAARGANLYVYKMVCSRGTIQMDFSIDPDGKIGLIFFE
jgi:hypothetical protein